MIKGIGQVHCLILAHFLPLIITVSVAPATQQAQLLSRLLRLGLR